MENYLCMGKTPTSHGIRLVKEVNHLLSILRGLGQTSHENFKHSEIMLIFYSMGDHTRVRLLHIKVLLEFHNVVGIKKLSVLSINSFNDIPQFQQRM